ncbi:MAG: Coq4 family protein [Bdellovibrionota bacterium]
MIKRFIRRLRSIRAFWKVVRDVERTDQLFVVITDPLVLNKPGLDRVVGRIRECPRVAALMDERFEGSWSLEELAKLPPGTLGYTYAKHMRDNNLDINFYPPVPGASEGAYLQSRGRQTHDIWHVMTGFDTSIPGEIGLQGFTQAQFHSRSPTLITTMFLFHCLFYKPDLLFPTARAFAHGWLMGERARHLFGERFEENWHKDLAQYRQELGIAAFVPAT